VLLLPAPGGKDWIDQDESTRNRLADIMSLHVLPPVSGINAVWTSPFFLEETTLPTLKSGTSLKVTSSNGGNAVLEAPSSSATIQQKDIYACKVRKRSAIESQHTLEVPAIGIDWWVGVSNYLSGAGYRK
jgi:hypothetical protein